MVRNNCFLFKYAKNMLFSKYFENRDDDNDYCLRNYLTIINEMLPMRDLFFFSKYAPKSRCIKFNMINYFYQLRTTKFLDVIKKLYDKKKEKGLRKFFKEGRYRQDIPIVQKDRIPACGKKDPIEHKRKFYELAAITAYYYPSFWGYIPAVAIFDCPLVLQWYFTYLRWSRKHNEWFTKVYSYLSNNDNFEMILTMVQGVECRLSVEYYLECYIIYPEFHFSIRDVAILLVKSFSEKLNDWKDLFERLLKKCESDLRWKLK